MKIDVILDPYSFRYEDNISECYKLILSNNLANQNICFLKWRLTLMINGDNVKSWSIIRTILGLFSVTERVFVICKIIRLTVLNYCFRNCSNSTLHVFFQLKSASDGIDDEVKAGVPRQYFYTWLFKQCFVRKQLYFPQFGLCSIYTCPTLKGYCLPQSYFFHTQN